MADTLLVIARCLGSVSSSPPDQSFLSFMLIHNLIGIYDDMSLNIQEHIPQSNVSCKRMSPPPPQHSSSIVKSLSFLLIINTNPGWIAK